MVTGEGTASYNHGTPGVGHRPTFIVGESTAGNSQRTDTINGCTIRGRGTVTREVTVNDCAGSIVEYSATTEIVGVSGGVSSEITVNHGQVAGFFIVVDSSTDSS